MAFSLNPLPFADHSLQPYMSQETVFYHYEKHHRGYVDKLNDALDSSLKEKSLKDLILTTEGKVFNNAAQVWNHDFFWRSLAPDQLPPKDGVFKALLLDSFGGIAEFCGTFKEAALSRFGSGWAWLVYNHQKATMECMSTPNADTPLRHGLIPLLTLDVWEHAYYLDYRNERERFVNEFLTHLVNWSFAAENLDDVLDNREKRRYA